MITKRHKLRKRRFNLTIILLTGLILILAPIGFFAYKFYDIAQQKKSGQANQSVNTSDFFQPTVPPSNTASDATTAPTKTATPNLPANALITIAFISQAPFANWDALHEDACEEASFLMVKHYLDKSALGSLADVDQEIQAMVAYQEQNGYGPSITVEQLAVIAKNKYGLSGQVKSATIKNIEADVATGHPVIVPAAGKLLGNPNFRNGGPTYHMLVVKGYDSTNFITNDPGTRKGNGYIYTHRTLMNAIHNWDAENILNGPAVYLVF